MVLLAARRSAARRHLHEPGVRAGHGGARLSLRRDDLAGPISRVSVRVAMSRRAKRSRGARAGTTTAASLALLVSAAAWNSTASASPIFPSAVDKDLGLPAMWVENSVAPPQGCLLCHEIQAGGLGTTNAFGGELKQNGAMAENLPSLQGALQAVAASAPLAISDIKMGTNPND